MKTVFTIESARDFFLTTRGKNVECLKSTEKGGMQTKVVSTYPEAVEFFNH